MIGAVRGVPAMAVGRRGDILAWNRPGHALLAPHLDFGAPDEPHARPNFVRMDFLDERVRDLYPDRDRKLRDDVAYLQVSASTYPHDEDLAAFLDGMRAASAEFAALWSAHPVDNCATVTRDYRHPELGVLTLTTELLRPPDDAGQGVVLHTAEPGSPSERALLGLPR